MVACECAVEDLRAWAVCVPDEFVLGDLMRGKGRRSVLTADEFRERVRLACVAAGSQRSFALANGMSPAYLGEVLSGTRQPGPLLLRVMRMRRRVSYEPLPVDASEFDDA